jgi:hypothetical protein
MNKAFIKNNIVENIIVVDPNNIPDWCADWPTVPETDNVYIGCLYEDGQFKPALIVETE